MRFEKGQKVVALKSWPESSAPKKDKTYIVEDFYICSNNGDLCLDLKGVVVYYDGIVCVWWSECFAPLEDIEEAETAVNELVKELEIEQYELN